MAEYVQVAYGFIQKKLSRRNAERFVMQDAAERGVPIPESPIAKFWCRPAPADAPLPFIIGFTAPAAMLRPPTPPTPQSSGLIVIPGGRN